MKLGDFFRGKPRSGRIRFCPKQWELPTYKSRRPPWFTLRLKEGVVTVLKYVNGEEIWLQEIIRGSPTLRLNLETEGRITNSRYGYQLFLCTTYPMRRGGHRAAP